ncbi:MAG TPA: B-box zinc finger protein [Nevskiaceae bacterium]|nr:B-box zinc finger protein [Nevskiaceae bacterium]
MKCATHLDQDAVGTCQDCGSGLCTQCAHRFNMPLCEKCLLRHNRAVAVDAYKGLAITAVIMAIAVWALVSSNGGHHVSVGNVAFVAILPAFTYWGWKFISDHQSTTLVMGLPLWLLYFSVKLIAAYVIGWVVGPYRLYTMLHQVLAVSKTKGQISRHEI